MGGHGGDTRGSHQGRWRNMPGRTRGEPGAESCRGQGVSRGDTRRVRPPGRVTGCHPWGDTQGGAPGETQGRFRERCTNRRGCLGHGETESCRSHEECHSETPTGVSQGRLTWGVTGRETPTGGHPWGQTHRQRPMGRPVGGFHGDIHEETCKNPSPTPRSPISTPQPCLSHPRDTKGWETAERRARCRPCPRREVAAGPE